MRHDEYRRVFSDLYRKLDELRPDVVVNTGDTVHSKTQSSAELTRVLGEHFIEMCHYAQYLILPGNHDFNMRNGGRLDVISPVVNLLMGDDLDGDADTRFLKRSGMVWSDMIDPDFGPTIKLWAFSLMDSTRWPTRSDLDSSDVNVALFHGPIVDARLDGGRPLSGGHDLSLFDGFDFVLLGDIHQHQFLGSDRRIAYAGSLIQQNHGELPGKGLLVWDIFGKDRHDVWHVPLDGAVGFHTVSLDDISTLDDSLRGSNVRVRVPSGFRRAARRDVELAVSHLEPESLSFVEERSTVASTSADAVKLRDGRVQESLLDDYVRRLGVPGWTIEAVVAIDRRLQAAVEATDGVRRGTTWRLESVAWSNLLRYGRENVIELDALPGITGIFGPNGVGKSCLFDVVLEALFDRTARSVGRNLELINDTQREPGVAAVRFAVDGETLTATRTVERVEYGARSGDVKETARMSLDLSVVRRDGAVENLNEDNRAGTEREIRRRVGMFEDFLMTAMMPQEVVVGVAGGGNFIACGDADRRRVLCRFLDIDVFDAKNQAARAERKELLAELKTLRQHRDRFIDPIELIREEYAAFERAHASALALVEASRAAVVEASRELGRLEGVGGDATLVERNERERDVAMLSSDLAGRQARLEQLRRSLEEMTIALSRSERPTATVAEARVALVAVKDDETRVEAGSREIDGLVNLRLRVLTQVATLEKVPCGGSYPTCVFIVDAVEARATTLPALDAQIADVKAKLVELTASVSLRRVLAEAAFMAAENVESIERSITSVQIQIAAAEIGYDDVRRRLNSARAVLEATRVDVDHERALNDAKAILAARTQDLANVESDIRTTGVAVERHGATIKKIDELDVSIAAAESKLTAVELYVDITGRAGLPREILATRVPAINANIAGLLDGIVDFSIIIELDDDSGASIIIEHNDGSRRSLGLAGGAQRFIAALAVRTALVQASSLPRPNVLFIDEGFGRLDADGMDIVQRMLTRLRDVFEHVLLVTHVDALKDIVDNVVEISTGDDGSAFVGVVRSSNKTKKEEDIA